MEISDCHADVCGDGFEKSRRISDGGISVNHDHLEHEKRVRREIANSNERRRMQSINAGFDSLRDLLPPIQDGEKMSKATILQLTAEYIQSLLNRVSLLENEVAVYRRTTGIQPTTIIPDFPIEFSVCRKRKQEEKKKRSSCPRSRRRRVAQDSAYNVSRSYLSHCSPVSNDIRQTSPSTSCNSSASVSPTSPIPDGTSSTSARLEHLVMAIEQIEGGRALHMSGTESQDGLSADEQSPAFSDEPYWQSPQGLHICSYHDTQDSNLKPQTSFTDILMLTPVSDVANVSLPVNEANSHNRNTTDYPVVSKLLNRPIPHKYLHRPQVVVNSSH
ncbi:unnamed protein product [Dicrocoelium dendriticum]|nr:unnamed protein product [Dicrocoelium dendriticum]